MAARGRGRPPKGAQAKTVPIAFRLTLRQWDALQKLVDRYNAKLRADHKYAVPMTIPDYIRMMILIEAESEGIIRSLLDEPPETFNVRARPRKQ